jgi:hypothetical protein
MMPGQSAAAFPAAQPAKPPASVTVHLETFAQDALERWEIDPPSATTETESRTTGLAVRSETTLATRGSPLFLPPRTRRLRLRVAGEFAGAAVVLRDAAGRARRVALERLDGRGEWLTASIPAGMRSVAALAVSPSPNGDARLLELAAEAGIGPGLFATVHQMASAAESSRRVEITNLGATAERAVLEAADGAPLAALDLAPTGRAVLHLERPAAAARRLRWRGGVIELGAAEGVTR